MQCYFNECLYSTGPLVKLCKKKMGALDMGNRKISLFQEPNCYADGCDNNSSRHLLMFFSSMIFAVKKY